MSSQLMSVQGPLARTVRDVRLGLAAMAARDAHDPWWVPAPLEGPPLRQPIRVTVVLDPDDLAGAKPHPAVEAAVLQAAEWLRDAGYEIVEEHTPGFTRAKELWFEMQMPEFRHFMLPLIEDEGDEGAGRSRTFKLQNVPVSTPIAYMKALAERARHVRDWALFLDNVPLVLAPVSTEPVYEQGFDIESAERTAALWRECSTLMAAPVLGLPSMVVPTGLVDGRPMGVQIFGPRFREDLCLAAAEAIEARAGLLTPIDPKW